ncbi:MAG: glycosyltransferase [Endomicrobia bacterium]|nr:glycosyltransferase [Endomicrobiia bacterium]
MKELFKELFDKITGRVKRRAMRNIRSIQLSSGKPIILFASSYGYFNSFVQRPNHLFKCFAEKGYAIIWPEKHIKKTAAVGNNIYLVPWELLIPLLRDRKITKIIMSIALHDTIKNLDKYLLSASKYGIKIIYEHLDDISFVKDVIKNESMFKKLNLRFKNICEDKKILISASSNVLFDQAVHSRGSKENVILVKNAVNPQDFICAKKNSIVPPPLQSVVAKQKPIVGYYGVLNEHYFDFNLMEEVIAEKQDFEFVFIGNFCKKSNELKKYPNFTYINKIPYNDIPFYACHFSIATIPFIVGDISNATSPVKLFEYMAMGLPIITTPMPECMLYKSCLIADSPKRYKEHMLLALKLKDDTAYQQILQEETAGNTWQKRVKELIEKIEINNTEKSDAH